jgi:lipopolysaccharide/colanic/teichoic acid biosynthesis glycosyltransferase
MPARLRSQPVTLESTTKSSTYRSRSIGHGRWWWKRPLDLVVAGLLLLLLVPLIGALVLLVRLDSAGPGIYRQRRIGRDGRPFDIWKLRTMTDSCDEGPHRAIAADWFEGRDRGGRFKTLDDPRVTGVGRWLRRSNLDELPQLVNVVRGEMSLVGPRPAIPYELEHYESWYFERLQARPGITGLWQVSDRGGLAAADMMELDRRYVREATLWLDLRILLWTGPALLLGLLREGL